MSFTFAGSAAALTATFFNSVQLPADPQPSFPQMDTELTEMIVPRTGFDDAAAYDVADSKEEKRLRKLIRKLEKEEDRREERREARRDNDRDDRRRDRDRDGDRDRGDRDRHRDRDRLHYCGDGHYHQDCRQTVDRNHDGWDSDGDGRDRDDGYTNRQRRDDKDGLSDGEKAAIAGVVVLGLGAIANQVMNGGGQQQRAPSNVLTDGKITRGEYLEYDVLGRARNGLVYVDVTLRNGAVVCGAGGRNDSITREGVGIVQMSPCND